MRKFIISIVLFAMAVVSLTSCLGSNTDYTYYDDAAITSFYVGTLNRYFHTTASDGSDSIYKKTLDCSGYTFNIDQAKCEIWNSDSLPVGIDPSKVICTISTKNSGSTIIKSMTSDSIAAYSSTDSIDFSQPRTFFIYNSNGTAYRTYTVRVNVHQEYADTCVWTEVANGNSQIASLSDMKAVCKDDNVYLFGNEGTTPKLYTTVLSDGLNWTEVATYPTLSAEAYKNIILKNDVFFCLSDGKVLTSVDAANWNEVSDGSNLKQLVAATTYNLYALSTDGKMMYSSDNGLTWNEDELDDDASLLPSDCISYACRELQTNDEAEKVVLIGNTFANTEHAVVWTKIDERPGGNTRTHAWSYTTQAPENKNKAPHVDNWQIVSYDYPNIKAICGNGISPDTTKAVSQIYQCGDDGINWLNDSIMKVPSGLEVSGNHFTMAVDKANSVWIICGGTGQVWKARINRLAWKEDEDYFDE